MDLVYRVIQAEDLESLQKMEEKKLTEQYTDEMERMMAVWNSKFRIEALNHYIALGWSFLAHDKQTKELQGYFIAQPLLFFDGQTQTLWVEHVQFVSETVRDGLCELAYKLGREKHLQRVYFPNEERVLPAIQSFKPLEWNHDKVMVKTTKG